MKSPLVTVLMPVHNAMPYLPLALASILDQTFDDYVVLALDDASTDGSGAYLDQLTNPKLIVRHESKRGTGAILNIGMRMSQSQLFARMDADDIAAPTRLTDQVEAMRRNHSLVMVGTQLDFLVANRVQRGLWYPLNHHAIVRGLLAGKQSLCPGTTVFKADVAERVGGHKLNGIGEDVDFCLRMTEHGLVANLPSVLYLYRLHGSSVGITQVSTLQRNNCYARLAAKQRRVGLIETTFEAFCRDWENRTILTRFTDACEARSFIAYRKARIEYANNRKIFAAAQLTTAASLQPFKAFRSVRRVIMRKAHYSEIGVTLDAR